MMLSQKLNKTRNCSIDNESKEHEESACSVGVDLQNNCVP